MGSAFSPQTIAALVEVITGGSGMRQKDPIGIYRSGPVLEHFFGLAGLELEIGSQSRVPAVRKLLVTTNKQEDGFEVIRRVIEQVADPSEYLDDLSKTGAVVEYLNKRLQADKYEVRLIDDRYRLLPRGVTAPVTSSLTATANFLNLDSVTRDFERALKQSESDPADAITAACS
ncbi:hypothetical protein MYX84_03675, partial [Acidobacteria bacterium AH-259-O06]|nr:hypothetical protein [Acidobacteria bacterium AH-259-O06]